MVVQATPPYIFSSCQPVRRDGSGEADRGPEWGPLSPTLAHWSIPRQILGVPITKDCARYKRSARELCVRVESYTIGIKFDELSYS